jgi:hypothetical protein
VSRAVHAFSREAGGTGVLLEPCPKPSFALVIFEIGSLFLPELAWTIRLLFRLPHIAGMISVHHHTQFLLVKMGSREVFTQAGLKP